MINTDEMIRNVEEKYGAAAPVSIWFNEMVEQYKAKGSSEWNDTFIIVSYNGTMGNA